MMAAIAEVPKPETKLAKLLTVEDVSALLQVSESWVRDHASGRRKPYLKSLKMGKVRRFEEHTVAEFIRELSKRADDLA